MLGLKKKIYPYLNLTWGAGEMTARSGVTMALEIAKSEEILTLLTRSFCYVETDHEIDQNRLSDTLPQWPGLISHEHHNVSFSAT